MHRPTCSRSVLGPMLAGLVVATGLAAPVIPGPGPAGAAPAAPRASTTLVVNELDYDQPSTDTAEFVEIKNRGTMVINLDSYFVLGINGSTTPGTEYRRLDLPNVNLAPGGNYVVCANAANTPNCNLDVSPDTDLIQNGAPDAVAIVINTTGNPADDILVDSVSYEGNTAGGPASGGSWTEGSGTGLEDPGTTGSDFLGISRFPDGTDTDQNNLDFSPRCITPGLANSSDASGCQAPGQVTPTPGPSATPVLYPEFLPANFGVSLVDPEECTGPGDLLEAELRFLNTGGAAARDANLTVRFGRELVGVADSCTFTGGENGACTVAGDALDWTGDVPPITQAPANEVVLRFQVRVAGGLKFGTDLTLKARLAYDLDGDRINESSLSASAVDSVDCAPPVQPNQQLDQFSLLPILGYQGQDNVCDSVIEVQLLGPEFAKVVLLTWGEPGFCPPQCAGPLKVECTGLLKPGSAWHFLGAQIPAGSKSAALFKFSARLLSEIGVDIGADDVVADYLCETLFFGVVGDCDDYRRFRRAYESGDEFAGVPMDRAAGLGLLAADVLRGCPGDLTPGVTTHAKYEAVAGTHLGAFDPVYGGFGFYAPLLYADKSGFGAVLYIQNAGLECSSIELWFKAQDDCLRAKICEIFTLAPGETFQYEAADCVGPDWQGSAWLRSTQPLAVVVDLVGRDVLMSYLGEPAELGYSLDPGLIAYTQGSQVLYGPLSYSEYQGWDTGVQVQNLSPVHNAKVKVYFLDRSGDIITTLVDWICPRGSQTFFLPVLAGLPGNWVGSLRVESQPWWTPGSPEVAPPNVVGVAMLLAYSDPTRTQTSQAIAYNLLPEHKAYAWQIGAHGGGVESGVGLIAVPTLLKDPSGVGLTTELAVTNLVPKPGFTDFAILLYDQNGFLDFVCQKLNEKQVEYIDLRTWGYIHPGFRGSAILSATFWEHEVFDETGFFLRNVVGLSAVAVERAGAKLDEDVPGDEAAGGRGIPFNTSDRPGERFRFDFEGPDYPVCPGQPTSPADCPASVTLSCLDCPGLVTAGQSLRSSVVANVPIACRIADADLRLDIAHPFIADLDAFLALTRTPLDPPLFTELFSDICGTADNIQAVLDDEAAAPIGSSCPPSGFAHYTTESGTGLAGFYGRTGAGEWTLGLSDDFPNDDGSLVDWALTLGFQ